MPIQPSNKITVMMRKKLEKEEWRVFTNHKETEQAISAHLASTGNLDDSGGEIFYNRKRFPVFIVNFKIVEFLAINRYSKPFSFTAYHRKNQDHFWEKWREGTKTPKEKIRREGLSKNKDQEPPFDFTEEVGL